MLKIYENYEEETHAVLLFGYKFEWSNLKDGGASLDALKDAVPGLLLKACCDLENTEEDDLEYSSFLYGVEIFTAFGYEEQMEGITWEDLKSKMSEAAQQVESALNTIQEHIDGGELGLHLGCCGWLANGWFVKGEWNTEIDWDFVESHGGKFADTNAAYPYLGTDGSSQESCTCGGALGVWIAGDSYDSSACTTINVSDAENARMDAILAEAGINQPKYFVISRYD